MVQTASVTKKGKQLRRARSPAKQYALSVDGRKSFTVRLPGALYAGVREYCFKNGLSLQDAGDKAYTAFLDGSRAAAVRAHDFVDASVAEKTVLRSCLELMRSGPKFGQSKDILAAVAHNWRKYQDD